MAIELPPKPLAEPAATYEVRHQQWYRDCYILIHNEKLTIDKRMAEAQEAVAAGLANTSGEGFSEQGVLSLVSTLATALTRQPPSPT